MKKIAMVIILLVIAVAAFFVFKNANENDESQDLLTDERYVEDEKTEDDIDSNLADETYKQQFIRTDSQGRVAVGVLFKNLLEDNDDNLIFEIMLNTHSVDLEQIDYAKLVTLKNEDGVITTEGFEWKKTEGSGHHIFGYLKVPKQYNGKNIMKETTEFIELEINGLDDIESRKFIWEEDALKYLKGNKK